MTTDMRTKLAEAKQGDTHLTRDGLYELVWAQPMTKVGALYGVSSSYMARVCSALNVPRPERGYWANWRLEERQLSQFAASENRPNDLRPTVANTDHFLMQMDCRVRIAHDELQLVADFREVTRLIELNPRMLGRQVDRFNKFDTKRQWNGSVGAHRLLAGGADDPAVVGAADHRSQNGKRVRKIGIAVRAITDV